MSVLETNTTEQELNNYITDIDDKLEAAHSRLVHGDGVYVGTEILRDFYRGKQWTYRKEGGGVMRTYNYCFTVIENMTAFLANETPEMHSEPRDIKDPVEQARSEGISAFLQEVHRVNRFPIQYQKGVRSGSLLGGSFIFGPVWDDSASAIRYYNLEHPENIRIVWRDTNYNEMEGFINRYGISVGSFRKAFKSQLAARGIDPAKIKPLRPELTNKPAVGDRPSWSRSSGIPEQDRVEVQEFYDDQYYMARVLVGEKEPIVVDFIEHNYGFIPGIFIPNIHQPGEPTGTSDIENILDAQVAYNESKSFEEDIVRQVANSALWGKNLDNYSVINTGAGVIYNFNDEADLQALPRSENPFAVEQFASRTQGDLVNLAQLNQALYPGGARSILASTGRALAIMMQGINNKVALRKVFWEDAISTLNRNILILSEKFVPGAKQLIDGNYKTSVFISSVLLRDVTEEINKFNAKVQSLTTTQKNLGMLSPADEQKLMKQELQDPILATEISRQPALLHSIIQQGVQAFMESQMQGENGQPALMVEGGGEAGEQPASTPQQRGGQATPAGAVRAQGQRTTGAPQIR